MSTPPLTRLIPRRVAVGAALAVAALGVAAGTSTSTAAVPSTVPPVLQKNGSMVTADALPTAQVDGIVWTQAIAGNRVFAGGKFATARPAGVLKSGTGSVTRQNLMAYDIRTGKMTSFAPALNGEVRALALSPDKSVLYVGGAFTKVGSTTRLRFAAFDVATGRLLKYTLPLNGQVNAITTIKSTVYLGGDFSAVGATPRLRLAAVNVALNKLTTWRPEATNSVKALVGSPDGTKVIVGGQFGSMNGQTNRGMAAVTAGVGALRPWKINTQVKSYGARAAVTSLAVDKDTVYGSTYGWESGNFEGVFAASPTDGSIKWLQDCHGDQYGVAPVGDHVYSVGHAHFCTNIGGFHEVSPQRTLVVTKAARGTVATNTQPGVSYANWAGQKAPAIYNWFPELNAGTVSGQNQAAWSVQANSRYTVLGGEFTEVNGRRQQGLVRFTTPANGAPTNVGPWVTGSGAAPRLDVAADGLRVGWTANYDYDDQTLHYAVLRDGKVIGQVSRKSNFWNRPWLSFLDKNAVRGRTYSYAIRVQDADGNIRTSTAVQARR